MKKYTSALWLAAFTLLLAACGGRTDPPDSDNRQYEAPQPEPYDGGAPYGGGGSPGTHEHLRVAVHYRSQQAIRTAAYWLIRDMAAQGITLTVDIVPYSTGHFGAGGLTYQSSFRRWTGDIAQYDLVHMLDIDALAGFAQAGQLADLAALMDTHGTFSRYDFFMNVLEAYMHEGRLYTMPLGFYMEMVGINTNIPHWVLVDEFAALERITLSELMAFFIALLPDIDFNENHVARYFGANYGNWSGVTPYGVHFNRHEYRHGIPYDLIIRHAANHYQGAELTQLLEDMMQLLPQEARPLGLRYNTRRASYFWSAQDEVRWGSMSAFASTRRLAPRVAHATTAGADAEEMLATGIHLLQALMGTPHGIFNHFIPLATTDGRLVAHPIPLGELAIMAEGNTTMALELLIRIPERVLGSPSFTGNHEAPHLQPPSSNLSFPLVEYHLPIPIVRRGLEDYLASRITAHLAPLARWDLLSHQHYSGLHFAQTGESLPFTTPAIPPENTWPQLTDTLTNRLLGYLQQPMAMTFPLPVERYIQLLEQIDEGSFHPQTAAIVLE